MKKCKRPHCVCASRFHHHHHPCFCCAFVWCGVTNCPRLQQPTWLKWWLVVGWCVVCFELKLVTNQNGLRGERNVENSASLNNFWEWKDWIWNNQWFVFGWPGASISAWVFFCGCMKTDHTVCSGCTWPSLYDVLTSSLMFYSLFFSGLPHFPSLPSPSPSHC